MVFETQIPRDALFLRASARGLPIGALEEGAGVQLVFDALRSEIEMKLGSNDAWGAALPLFSSPLRES